MSSAGGFQLVLQNPYLRLIAMLIVLLNVVNTTGEYLISRLLTAHVQQLAQLDPAFDRQAFIGAYIGEYQSWVNLTAFLLQAFVASRLVKYRGLAGVLLALPLIALGGYSHHRGGRRVVGRPLDQDGRERDRLLDHEHGAPAPVAADDARGEVQGEAGDRHVLRPRRRRALRWRRLRRHQRPALERVAVRCREHCADAGLAGDCRPHPLAARRMASPAVAPVERGGGRFGARGRRPTCCGTRNARRAARRRTGREGEESPRVRAHRGGAPDPDGREHAPIRPAGLRVHRQRLRRRWPRGGPGLSREVRRYGNTRRPRRVVNGQLPDRNRGAQSAGDGAPARAGAAQRTLAGRPARRVLRRGQRLGAHPQRLRVSHGQRGGVGTLAGRSTRCGRRRVRLHRHRLDRREPDLPARPRRSPSSTRGPRPPTPGMGASIGSTGPTTRT